MGGGGGEIQKIVPMISFAFRRKKMFDVICKFIHVQSTMYIDDKHFD